MKFALIVMLFSSCLFAQVPNLEGERFQPKKLSNLLLEDVKDPFKKSDKDVLSFAGEQTIRVNPDIGRLVVTIKTSGLRTPDAVKNENTNFSNIIAKLSNLGVKDKDILLLKRVWNDDYKEIEIWGGVQHRGNAMVKDGYAVYSTIDVSLKEPKNLQTAIDVITESKNRIHAAGYSFSGENESIKLAAESAYKIANEKASEFQKMFGQEYKVVSVKSEVFGERISPVLGITLTLTVRVSIVIEIPRSITP